MDSGSVVSSPAGSWRQVISRNLRSKEGVVGLPGIPRQWQFYMGVREPVAHTEYMPLSGIFCPLTS